MTPDVVLTYDTLPWWLIAARLVITLSNLTGCVYLILRAARLWPYYDHTTRLIKAALMLYTGLLAVAGYRNITNNFPTDTVNLGLSTLASVTVLILIWNLHKRDPKGVRYRKKEHDE